MLVRAPANSNSRQQRSREETARAALAASLRVHERMLEECAGAIAAIATILIDALKSGHKVLFCGNGGSAADSQHAAAELVGRFYKDRRALPALALTTDSSVLTAVGNDWDYREVFARQVAALGSSGDVLVGLSTSGSSENLLRAFEEAHSRQLTTVALTGEAGRQLAATADFALRVPADCTPRIQELHILALHSVCELVEHALFGDTSSDVVRSVQAGTS